MQARDLPRDTWRYVWYGIVPDGSGDFNAAESRFDRSQGLATLLIAERPFQLGMVAFDPVVSRLSVNVCDAVEMSYDSKLSNPHSPRNPLTLLS